MNVFTLSTNFFLTSAVSNKLHLIFSPFYYDYSSLLNIDKHPKFKHHKAHLEKLFKKAGEDIDKLNKKLVRRYGPKGLQLAKESKFNKHIEAINTWMSTLTKNDTDGYDINITLSNVSIIFVYLLIYILFVEFTCCIRLFFILCSEMADSCYDKMHL